jgi:predicted metal-dependent hydrolase
MTAHLRYIQGYPDRIIEQIDRLISEKRFVDWFKQKYPDVHTIQSERDLYVYTMDIKQRFMKKTSPLHKVVYDSKIHLIHNALGLHQYVSKVQGSKIKTQNEIRIASIFKQAPEPLLRMLVVHELAHLKEKDHNKAFYQLCCHMEPSYHQLEFDARLFMIFNELNGK